MKSVIFLKLHYVIILSVENCNFCLIFLPSKCTLLKNRQENETTDKVHTYLHQGSYTLRDSLHSNYQKLVSGHPMCLSSKPVQTRCPRGHSFQLAPNHFSSLKRGCVTDYGKMFRLHQNSVTHFLQFLSRF